MMASHKRGTIYIGVTTDLLTRAAQHKDGTGSRFTSQHRVKRLVYYQYFDHIEEAIAEEKRLKAWKRAWKIALVEEENPEWRDLYWDVNQPPPTKEYNSDMI